MQSGSNPTGNNTLCNQQIVLSLSVVCFRFMYVYKDRRNTGYTYIVKELY